MNLKSSQILRCQSCIAFSIKFLIYIFYPFTISHHLHRKALYSVHTVLTLSIERHCTYILYSHSLYLMHLFFAVVLFGMGDLSATHQHLFCIESLINLYDDDWKFYWKCCWDMIWFTFQIQQLIYNTIHTVIILVLTIVSLKWIFHILFLVAFVYFTWSMSIPVMFGWVFVVRSTAHFDGTRGTYWKPL